MKYRKYRRENFFVFDTLLTYMERCLGDFGKVVEVRPAFVKGKLWRANRIPIALRPNDKYHEYMPNHIFGGLFTLDLTSYAYESLDAHEGCSLSRLGVNHPSDLIHRVETVAYPITFDSIEDFVISKFKAAGAEKCMMYVGNLAHPDIQHIFKLSDWNLKRRFGVALKEFKERFGGESSAV